MSRPIYVLNGPNLNRLGKREPEIYGTTTLAEIEAMCREAAGDRPVRFHQSNIEGEIVDWIHEAIDDGAGIVINPAGLHLHLARHPRRAEDVPWPDHRAAHLQHPPARGHLSQFPCLEGRDRRDRRPRAARLCRRGARHVASADRLRDRREGLTMKTSIATVSISGDLAREARGDRRGRLRRRRDLRERFPGLRRHAARRRPHGARPRPGDHAVPAVPRFRGPARAAAHRAPSTGPSASST